MIRPMFVAVALVTSLAGCGAGNRAAGGGAASPDATLQAETSTSRPQARDGEHDFDFNVGSWRGRMSRLQQPLAGSTTWVDLAGTVVAHNVGSGGAQVEEIAGEGATGHFDELAFFLYDAASRRWSMYFASHASGTLSVPMIGEFKDGRGEFFDDEIYEGKTIRVRGVWSNVTPNSHRFEQAFSEDGGKTWEKNLVAELTRQGT